MGRHFANRIREISSGKETILLHFTINFKLGDMCISNTSSSQTSIINNQIEGCQNLSQWINRLKCKEAILKRSKFRDLRREVLINHAAIQAQRELEHRQKLNRQRWEQLKAKQLQKCSHCNAFLNFCSCTSSVISKMDLGEESKKLDEFFDSMNLSTRKRKTPNILKPNCKRPKVQDL